ncbi:MAG: XRE family transcriptional regulator [Gammaproteobacteria bacterium]|nr:XRE family transcriptional regulator [Gammaproteobacteria bacterium]
MNKSQDQTDSIEIMESSGNVFQDLSIPNAEEYLAKAELARRINAIIDDLGLKKQIDAAKRLGIDQPKISAIRRGQLTGFSLERLISYLNKLDQDVEIIVKAKPPLRKDHGHLQVAFG